MRQKIIDKITDLCNQGLQDRLASIEAFGRIIELCKLEDRAEKMAEDVQELIYLANVVDSFTSMAPGHPSYKSVFRDIRASLDKLKQVHHILPDDA